MRAVERGLYLTSWTCNWCIHW